MGNGAGGSLTSGSNDVYIANPGLSTETGTIRIGTGGTHGQLFLAGVFGTTLTGSSVVIDGNGQLGVTTSSRRFKTDIQPVGRVSDRLMALRPVSFHYKRRYVHGASPLQYGLIAEDVAKVYPNLVVDGPDGKPYTVAYQELPALLLAGLQREHARVSRQQREIDQLSAQLRARGRGRH